MDTHAECKLICVTVLHDYAYVYIITIHMYLATYIYWLYFLIIKRCHITKT